MQLLAAAIQGPLLDADEPVTLQRQHGPSQCRAIHDELAGKRVDRHGPQTFELRQDGELRRAQSFRCQTLVIELGHVTSRLAQCQAIAHLERLFGFGWHRSRSPRTLDNESICAYIKRIYADVK